MTIYHLLMAFGAVVVLGIIVKGFWSATHVQPKEQPDNWSRYWGTNADGI